MTLFVCVALCFQLQAPEFGTRFPYPIIRAAHIDLDIPKAIFTLTQPFGNHVLKQYIWLDLQMPLDVTVTIYIYTYVHT